MIVRGSFSTLFSPGLITFTFPEWHDVESCPECMAIVHPDSSQAPKWRFPPKRKESPIRAYRAWEIEFDHEGRGWRLRSLAANFYWDGPFVRADGRPVDPKLWDAAKKESKEKYYNVVSHICHYAGIWAVKNKKILKEVISTYYAPAWGEVDLWGRVAQFTLGYRAEFCMIKKLWLDVSYLPKNQRNEQGIKHDLEQRYDCDVELA